MLLAEPPLEVVYHFNEVPLALRGLVRTSLQYEIGDVTAGAAGTAFTTTEMGTRELSHPSTDVCVT